MTQGRVITFESTAGQATGYLAAPGDKPSKAGIVVIQEWWGLVPHIKDIANRLAEAGYIALAPDLYHGESTVEAEEASHLMQGLDWGRAAQELAGAAAYLTKQANVEKIGVIGFCMGGALTMIAATERRIDAYAAFYGFPPKGAAPLDRISGAGLIVFGENETHFSIAEARSFVEAQKRRGREAELVVYPGAEHGFFNDTRPVYKKDAAVDAWKRALELFERTLKN